MTVFNYTEARTNNLANWFWVAEAVALLIAGVLSDRLLVRKPFLIVGTVISWFAPPCSRWRRPSPARATARSCSTSS